MPTIDDINNHLAKISEDVAEIKELLKRIDHSQGVVITDLLSAILEVRLQVDNEILKLANEAKKGKQ